MSGLRTRAALVAGGVAGRLSRAVGRGAGAQIAGAVTLAIAPDALADAATRDDVALVSATNGKTTTTRLLAAALEAAGHPVVTNATGANLAAGLVATLGRPHEPGVAVLEVDERVLPGVVDPLDAELLVLGNLSRDQLDRFGEVRSLAARWREACLDHPGVAVVANASDPNVAWAAAPSRPTWVELGSGWRADAATCPACGGLLTWSGGRPRYRCGRCGFSQPEAHHALEGAALRIGPDELPLDLRLPGPWNRANAALAVVAAVSHFEVPAPVALGAVARIASVSGRYTVHHLPDGRPARLLLAKNPAGWSEVLHWIAGRETGVVLAVNAHVADGRDTSWLWDAPFELLRGRPVVASGERATDVAVRLDYAGVTAEIETEPLAAMRHVAGGEVHVVASYTQFTALSRALR